MFKHENLGGYPGPKLKAVVDNKWADLGVLFDGAFDCTAAGQFISLVLLLLLLLLSFCPPFHSYSFFLFFAGLLCYASCSDDKLRYMNEVDCEDIGV